jgi:hypothetical protein
MFAGTLFFGDVSSVHVICIYMVHVLFVSTMNTCYAADLKKAFEILNPYGFFVKFMDRFLAVNSLDVFVNWFDIVITSVRLESVISGIHRSSL